MQFSKLAMAAAASVGSLASAQLIPFDITGAGGDSFDYPFSALEFRTRSPWMPSL